MKEFKHNKITYSQLKHYIDRNEDCCVVNPCGSGKSYIIDKVLQDYSASNILVVTKQANAIGYYRGMSKSFKHITIITYNKLYNLYVENRLVDLSGVDICIFDEAHYIGASKWSKAVDELRKVSDCISIGVTATPQRYEDQGTDLSIIDKFGGNSAGNFTTQKLQKSGVFVEPEYIVSLASLDDDIKSYTEKIMDSDLSDDEKEQYLKDLSNSKEIWETSYSPKIVFRDTIENYLYKKSGNKILVFSKDIKSIDSDMAFITGLLEEQFPNKSIKAYSYSCKTSDEVLNEFLDDTDNYINILFSVNKVCETVHISDLSILIFLRSSNSNRVITQQIGRLNNIGNRNKGLIIDMVNNLSRYRLYDGDRTIKRKCIYCNTSNKIQSTEIKYNFKYIDKVTSIFDRVDSVTRFRYYNYQGFKGTLRQVCYVFRRKYDKVKLLINQGYSLEEAMNSTKAIHKLSQLAYVYGKPNIKYDLNFKLSDNEKEIVNDYREVVDNIIESKGCNDEEIISDCYLYLCYLVHTFFEMNLSNIDIFIRTKILAYLLVKIRIKYDTEFYKAEFDISGSYESFKEFRVDDVRTALIKNFESCNLTDREKIVLILRFGLVDMIDAMNFKFPIDNCSDFVDGLSLRAIATKLGLTPERIRQMEAKAIRKLTKSVKRQDLKEYLY